MLDNSRLIVLSPSGQWWQVTPGTPFPFDDATIISSWTLGQTATTGGVCCVTCETSSPCRGGCWCHSTDGVIEHTNRVTVHPTRESGCCGACARPDGACGSRNCLCHLARARRELEALRLPEGFLWPPCEHRPDAAASNTSPCLICHRETPLGA